MVRFKNGGYKLYHSDSPTVARFIGRDELVAIIDDAIKKLGEVSDLIGNNSGFQYSIYDTYAIYRKPTIGTNHLKLAYTNTLNVNYAVIVHGTKLLGNIRSKIVGGQDLSAKDIIFYVSSETEGFKKLPKNTITYSFVSEGIEIKSYHTTKYVTCSCGMIMRWPLLKKHKKTFTHARNMKITNAKRDGLVKAFDSKIIKCINSGVLDGVRIPRQYDYYVPRYIIEATKAYSKKTAGCNFAEYISIIQDS